jgi:hypothetical protein
VTMETNVQLDLVTLSKDVFTLTKFVTITMLAPPILAQMDNVSSLQLFANNNHAKLFLVM